MVKRSRFLTTLWNIKRNIIVKTRRASESARTTKTEQMHDIQDKTSLELEPLTQRRKWFVFIF